RRYQTAESLAADIGRVLRHEPVAARPSSIIYRTRKRIARGRLPIAVGALCVAIVAGAALVARSILASRRGPRDEKADLTKTERRGRVVGDRFRVYTQWPFDGGEAKRRQNETAKALGVEVEQEFELGSGVKITMVLIPAGEFVIGSPKGEPQRRREEDRKELTIARPFWMSKCEVTQAQWEAVMGRNPSKFKGADNPVESISLSDIQAFLEKANARGPGVSFALPTEAQWEYACRAGTTTPFHFGATVSTISTAQLNHGGDLTYGNRLRGVDRRKTMPVGSFPANAWGLHDMHGNVWEWCASPYAKTYDGSEMKGTEAKGLQRTLRGGSWSDNPGYCRSATRCWVLPSGTSPSDGLRLVVSSAARTLPNAGGPTEPSPTGAAKERRAKERARRVAAAADQQFWPLHPTMRQAPNGWELMLEIDEAKSTISTYGGGHVVIGRVVLDGPGAPEHVTSQMEVLEGGYFAGVAKDLIRPIGFRMHQYAPVDVELNDRSGSMVDIGTVRMLRLPPEELADLTGKIALEGDGNPGAASVDLYVTCGPTNRLPNVTYTRRNRPRPIRADVRADGTVSAGGFSPMRYRCTVDAAGFVEQSLDLAFQPGQTCDLGTITLERARHITLSYMVAERPPFGLSRMKQTVLSGGDRWRATPDAPGWDLQFDQSRGEILIGCGYGPCFLRDLGEGRLEDLARATAAEDLPIRLGKHKAQSGHVYLVDQRYFKHWIIFRVSIKRSDSGAGP
ncbi:formylglycine-generating enzyme family protein, partial [Planctomycetota bacterium]